MYLLSNRCLRALIGLYMWIVEVIPIKRGIPKENLTYFSAEQIKEGTIVLVPVRSKSIEAITISCRDARDEKSAIKSGSFALRKISKVKGDSPVPNYIFETAKLASQYYRTTRGHILDLIIPDYSYYGLISEHNKIESKKNKSGAQPERLLFQAPLEDRLAFYRTNIREAFAKKESITFICPTIADCELFYENLSRGISDFIVVVHGELGKKKLIESIKKYANDSHPFIIITTPTYASLMRHDTSVVILEHESSNAYITPTNPPYDFRVIMEIMARSAHKKSKRDFSGS